MTTLVTGATGFLGGHLARRLLGAGRPVRALVRHGSDVRGLSGAELAIGDVHDPASLERAVEGCALVFHLAGVTPRVSHARGEYMTVNATGTDLLARAAARSGARRFVLASSTSVYGGLLRRHGIREDVPLRPDTPYGRSKVEAERVLRVVALETGLEGVAARIGSTLGPSSRAWGGLFADVATGRCRIVGAGMNHHHWGYVDDVVEGLIRCAEGPASPVGAYNLAGPDSAPLAQLLAWIAEAVGASAPARSRVPALALVGFASLSRSTAAIAGVPLPRHDRAEFFIGDRTFDLTRAREELGHVPRIPLREAIRRTAEWLAAAADPSVSLTRA